MRLFDGFVKDWYYLANMTNHKGAKILTVEEVDKLQYPLPKSWIRAAGLLKHKKIDPVKYQKKIRLEWETRLKKLEKQFHVTKKK